jgi:hypothetical protein
MGGLEAKNNRDDVLFLRSHIQLSGRTDARLFNLPALIPGLADIDANLSALPHQPACFSKFRIIIPAAGCIPSRE